MNIKWSDDARQTWNESFEYCIENYGKHFVQKLLKILERKLIRWQYFLKVEALCRCWILIRIIIVQ